MPARRILLLGDPILRQVSHAMDDSQTATRVASDLADTLHEFRFLHGFGRAISAVQIGEPSRLIYAEFNGQIYTLVNPEYRWQSAETFELWDDCFSFPDLLVRVRRYKAVRIEYHDLAGNRQLTDASGPLSELLQHEMDHLDGVLAVDRAADTRSLCVREEWERRYRKPSSLGK